ncbi:MAG TPA: LPS assembly protein LptD [Terriglobales bacterium]|nr:LPS assembly protein LptD [Terriglobales bacterium]
MTFRIRILITALCICHQLALPRLVTSQLPRLAVPPQIEEVTIKAEQQEKVGDVYHLRGNVEVEFRSFVIRADQVTYNSDTGEVSAEGHFVFDGGLHDEHIEATHGTYNVQTDSGTFYDVAGSTGARVRGANVLLTSSNPFTFAGEVVEKTGPDHFVVHHGYVTSCQVSDRKWTFNSERVVVEVGQDAKLYHSNFRFFRVPLIYFPYARLPVEKIGRQSGFLIPVLGQSSRKGTIIGESVYWAINRSMDATIGAEYFSHRGWAQHGEFRVRPSETSYLNVHYFGVLDRGFGSAQATPGTPAGCVSISASGSCNQGGEEANISGEARLAHDIRAVADLNYLSSFVFRLAFAESFTQAVNSEVKSVAFASKIYNGFFFNGMASRYQNYQSTNPGDLITIIHAPSVDLGSVEHRLGPTPLEWSYDFSAQGVSRREPDFVTDNLVGRVDVHPRIAAPLHWQGWDFRPELGLHDTYYTQDRIPGAGIGTPGTGTVNRRALETSFEIRPPSLSRIYQRKLRNYSIKHIIEPRVVYRYVTGVDNFANIIRFDAQDIVSNTNELEYGVINRIYVKGGKDKNCEVPMLPPSEGPQRPSLPTTSAEQQIRAAGQTTCQVASAREIITWEIKQKYFFDPNFGNALVTGQRNVFTTTAEYAGIAFLTDPRNFTPIVSRLRIKTTPKTDVQWELDYDTKKGRINASTAILSYRVGDFYVAGSHSYFLTPGEVAVSTPAPAPTDFNQFRWLVGYGNPNKRGLNAAVNLGFDVNTNFLQYSAVQTSYNWDCCGLNFEYRRLALGQVRNENQYLFALTLTNIGTFGTLRRQQRLF